MSSGSCCGCWCRRKSAAMRRKSTVEMQAIAKPNPLTGVPVQDWNGGSVSPTSPSEKKLARASSDEVQVKRRPRSSSTSMEILHGVAADVTARLSAKTRRRRQVCGTTSLTPDNRVRMVWELLLLGPMVWTAVITPYRVCFWAGISDPVAWLLAEYFISAMFTVDIAFNFFFSFKVGEGDFTVQEKRNSVIAAHYLKTWFVLDVVSVIPFELIFPEIVEKAGVGQLGRVSKLPRTLKVLRLLKFTRLLRVLHLNQFFTKVSAFLVLRPAVNRILVSMFWAFILSHLIACLWHYAATLEEEANTWVVLAGLEDASPFRRYLAAMYWSVATLCGGGLPSLLSAPVPELAIAYAAMFIGLLWAGWVVGNILSVIQSIDRQQQDVNTKKVSRLLSKYGSNIPRSTSVELMKWAETTVSVTVEDVLAEFPKHLRNQATQHVYRPMLSPVSLLNQLPEELQTEVLVAGHYTVLDAGATVFLRGAVAHSMFIMLRGQAVTLTSRQRRECFAGSVFGAFETVYEQDAYMVTCKCKTRSALLRISIQVLLKLCSKYPRLRNKLRKASKSFARAFELNLSDYQERLSIRDVGTMGSPSARRGAQAASSPPSMTLRDSANLLRQRAAASSPLAAGGASSGSRRGSLTSSASVRSSGLRLRVGGGDGGTGAAADAVTRAEFHQLLVAVHALTASQEELLSEVRELRSTVMLGMT